MTIVSTVSPIWTIRVLLVCSLICGQPPALFARVTPAWSFQQMFDKADLVVIGEVASTKDTDEHSSLEEIRPPVPVTGVTTTFNVRLVLKGSPRAAEVQLHHYRFRIADHKLEANSPELVDISGRGQLFLLFLTREKDERYAPVTGQTDPALFSVLEIKSGAIEAPER